MVQSPTAVSRLRGEKTDEEVQHGGRQRHFRPWRKVHKTTNFKGGKGEFPLPVKEIGYSFGTSEKKNSQKKKRSIKKRARGIDGPNPSKKKSSSLPEKKKELRYIFRGGVGGKGADQCEETSRHKMFDFQAKKRDKGGSTLKTGERSYHGR